MIRFFDQFWLPSFFCPKNAEIDEFYWLTFLKGGERMGKMKYIEIQVQEILQGNFDARDDDNILFYEYLKAQDYADFGALADQIMETKMITKFKSVARVRRKLQEHNPLLWGKKRQERMDAQEIFKQYARE